MIVIQGAMIGNSHRIVLERSEIETKVVGQLNDRNETEFLRCVGKAADYLTGQEEGRFAPTGSPQGRPRYPVNPSHLAKLHSFVYPQGHSTTRCSL